MAVTSKTQPVFEIYLKGGDVRPEDIPLSTLSSILGAVQRLSSGPSGHHVGKEEEDTKALRLLSIKRGSTTLPIYVPADEQAIDHLRLVNRIIQEPESIGEDDYVLGGLKELSHASKVLRCPIVVRRPGTRGEILATCNENTYKLIASTVFVSGETSFVGKIERVGNATGVRCGLHVSFHDRMIYCKVQTVDLARRLGQLLYEDVVVYGEATWLKTSWKIVGFEIKAVTHRNKEPLDVALEALRKAGGDGWDGIDDPIEFIRETTG